MRFLIQNTHTGTAEDRAAAERTAELFRDLDLSSPDHLVITLRDHFEVNGLPYTVAAGVGVVNVSSAAGIILRFRSPN